MIPIFESILPIFLIVLLGAALRRLPFIDQSVWPGLETLGYYLLFPALLFLTLATADFSGIELGTVALVALIAVAVMTLLLIALHPLARGWGMSDSRYTSLFQTSSRWNAFIALAIAEKLSGASGLALVALVIAVIVIPLNLINVIMLIWYGTGARNMTTLARRIAGNPLILGCAAGIIINALPFGLYPPVAQSVDLIARTSLGLGLLMVGAGLKLNDVLRPGPAVLSPVMLKLIVFPIIMVGLAWTFGLTGEPLMILALCASVPTAMNGYLLARQMGGDAPLYAAVTTMQTVVSFVTIPAVMWAVGLISAGQVAGG
ncbi:AEC family transporter [Hoeflea sp. YIM 152468]|uniref:AEC family transporter n=1 Tax=Hoeflea sp. YIM 152468 TaxID=3031759 RepID=UPI0023DBDD87|nr:AEC family transporter [Hoeflea sp. YIM 152468]MDF1607082.1 AEC family transporter [Hoeflea sp. YIM 152468]